MATEKVIKAFLWNIEGKRVGAIIELYGKAVAEATIHYASPKREIFLDDNY